jgi:RNA polymerase sigma factor (sigma-70 family)
MVLGLGATGELSDRQLLERFVSGDGEPAELAFTALVERHGPMVLRVCRNALRNPHDAQDAFQATFLVLVQKARRLWVRDSLGPWLHRVAHRVAARARESQRRRRGCERRAAGSTPKLVVDTKDLQGLEVALHEEIDRLQDRYRMPIVLCHLEGLTQERAARLLALPLGTIKSRLRRAREVLRGRLRRRGLGTTGGLLIADATSRGAGAAVPLTLVDSTVRAAVAAAMSRAAALGVISASAAKLTQEVTRAMFMTKLKMVPIALLMVVCALAAGAAGVLAQQGAASQGRSGSDQRRPAGSDVSGGAAGVESASAPSYIRHSRTMIITRLEQELAQAQAKLDRTLKRVHYENDPEVVRARRTVDALDRLLARIDMVLVDAVDRYPTIFDFSGGQSGPSPGAMPKDPRHLRSDTGRPAPGGEPSDDNEFVRARERVQRFMRTDDRGYLSRQQLDRELAECESAIAKVESELIRARDRLEWAKKMLAKGYVSQHDYESAVQEHDAALRVKARWTRVLQGLEAGRNSQQDRQPQNQQQKPERGNPNQSQQRQDRPPANQEQSGREQGRQWNHQRDQNPEQGNPDQSRQRQNHAPANQEQSGQQQSQQRNNQPEKPAQPGELRSQSEQAQPGSGQRDGSPNAQPGQASRQTSGANGSHGL